MSRKKLSRNAPCPCGSGKKYKKCCWGKEFDWEEDDAGNLFKSVPISEEMADVFKEQRRKFIEKFGREPGPNDQIFFDMPHPEHIEHMTVEAMKKAGIDPAMIYATRKPAGWSPKKVRIFSLMPTSTSGTPPSRNTRLNAKRRRSTQWEPWRCTAPTTNERPRLRLA